MDQQSMGVSAELESFESFENAKLWSGGFMDCDPLNPLG